MIQTLNILNADGVKLGKYQLYTYVFYQSLEQIIQSYAYGNIDIDAYQSCKWFF